MASFVRCLLLSLGRYPTSTNVGVPQLSILFEKGSYRQLPPESCLSVPHQAATFAIGKAAPNTGRLESAHLQT